jgi:amino acid permease
MIDSNTVTDSTCGDEYLDNNDTTGQSSVPAKKSGIFGASSNLVNSIVGAGIIGIPYAFKQSGLIAGVILLILVSYLTGTFLVA